MFNIKEITTIKERLDLKSSLVQYINERVIKYTRLDRHDKAILVLLQENKDLEKEIKELEEKNKTFEDYNKDLNRQINKLEEDLDAEKSINSYLSRRILKSIEYINNTDLGTLDKWKLQEILKGEENDKN